MKIIDLNVCLYAVNADSHHHMQARDALPRLQKQRTGSISKQRNFARTSMRWIRLRLICSLRRQREQAQMWLRAHPRMTALLERMGCLHVHESAISRGVAAGAFIAFTPTMGIQTLLLLCVCWLFRANFVAAFIVSWVFCNALTVGLLYFAYHNVGEAVFGWLIIPLIHTPGIAGEVIEDGAFLIAGSLLIAPAAATCAYLISVWILRGKSMRLAKRKQFRAQALLPEA